MKENVVGKNDKLSQAIKFRIAIIKLHIMIMYNYRSMITANNVKVHL
jgi:hypothetical protein